MSCRVKYCHGGYDNTNITQSQHEEFVHRFYSSYYCKKCTSIIYQSDKHDVKNHLKRIHFKDQKDIEDHELIKFVGEIDENVPNKILFANKPSDGTGLNLPHPISGFLHKFMVNEHVFDDQIKDSLLKINKLLPIDDTKSKDFIYIKLSNDVLKDAKSDNKELDMKIFVLAMLKGYSGQTGNIDRRLSDHTSSISTTSTINVKIHNGHLKIKQVIETMIFKLLNIQNIKVLGSNSNSGTNLFIDNYLPEDHVYLTLGYLKKAFNQAKIVFEEFVPEYYDNLIVNEYQSSLSTISRLSENIASQHINQFNKLWRIRDLNDQMKNVTVIGQVTYVQKGGIQNDKSISISIQDGEDEDDKAVIKLELSATKLKDKFKLGRKYAFTGDAEIYGARKRVKTDVGTVNNIRIHLMKIVVKDFKNVKKVNYDNLLNVSLNNSNPPLEEKENVRLPSKKAKKIKRVLNDLSDENNNSRHDSLDDEEKSRQLSHDFDLSKGNRNIEVDLNYSNARKNKYGETLLHYASIKGNLELAEKLIKEGHDVNERDNYNWLPIHEAAINGHADIVQLLINNGSLINDLGGREFQASSPLHDACSKAHLDVIKVLIDSGADVSMLDGDLRMASSYLKEAKTARNSNYMQILELIEKKEEANYRSKKRKTRNCNSENRPKKRRIEKGFCDSD